MKVLVIGAGGKTGRLVVERAVAAGHAVTAFSRGSGTVPGAQTIDGDALDRDMVAQAVAGQEAVIDTVGGKTPFLKTNLEASIAANIVAGMRRHAVKRLVVVSAMGVGDSMEQAPFWYEHLLIPTFLRGSTADKSAMEDEVASSGIDYVIVRPAALSDGEGSGSPRVLDRGEKGYKTMRGDLARFLVDQLSSDAHVGQAVTVVSDPPEAR